MDGGYGDWDLAVTEGEKAYHPRHLYSEELGEIEEGKEMVRFDLLMWECFAS